MDNLTDEEVDILSIPEESYHFDEPLVHLKFTKLQPKDQKEGPETNETTDSHTLSLQKSDTHRWVGLVDVDQAEFNQKAIEEWTLELLNACKEAGLPNPYEDSLRKRMLLQKFLHTGLIASKNERKNQKDWDEPEDDTSSAVPAVVRLSILTMFPLIASLSQVENSNYKRLCTQTLGVVVQVMNTLSPLSLRTEPQDCLDAFKDFISERISTATSEQDLTHAVVALVGLVIASGGSANLLYAVDALFKAQEHTSDKCLLQIGHFLSQIGKFQTTCPAALPTDQSSILDGSWVLEKPANDEKTRDPAQLHSSFATDGKFFYFHNYEHGLLKVGGGEETISRHIYKSKPNYLVVKRTDFSETKLWFDSHMMLIQDNLYLLSPHLSKPDSAPGLDSSSSVPKLSPVVAVIDKDTLEERYQITLNSVAEASNCRAFTDSRFIYVLSRKEQQSKIDPASILSSLRNQIELAAASEGVGRDEILQHLETIENAVEAAEDLEEEEIDDSNEETKHAISQAFLQYHNAVVLQKKQEKQPPDPNPSTSEESLVEVFDPLLINEASASKELSPVRSFRLFENGQQKPKDSKQTPPKPVLNFVDYLRGEIYACGQHIVVLATGEQNTRKGLFNLQKARVFSSVDGSFVGEYPIRQMPANSTAAYCTKSNRLWFYTHIEMEVSLYNNCGTWHDTQTNAAKTNTAEHFLAQKAFSFPEAKKKLKPSEQRQFHPFEAIVFLIANLDRLARNHEFYSKSDIVDATQYEAPVEHQALHFVLDNKPQVLNFFNSVLLHIVKHIESDNANIGKDTLAYLLHASLRLLKINFHHLLISHSSLERAFIDAGIQDGGVETLESLKALLFRFIKSDFAIAAQEMQPIRDEAISTFSVAFTAFYPTPVSQAAFIRSLFAKKDLALLQKRLLFDLAHWYRASDILAQEPIPKETRQLHSSTEPKPVTSSEKATFTPVNSEAFPFLQDLVENAIKEAELKLMTETAPPLALSPTNQLLLVLQRDILFHVFGVDFLIKYSTLVLHQCSNVLEKIADQKEMFEENNEQQTKFDRLLDSVIGTTLKSLVLSLSRKQNTDKPEIVHPLIEQLLAVISNIDKANIALKSSSRAHQQYLVSQNDKKVKRKQIFESQHPYPLQKEQMKRTITIPNASALSLQFDPRSRTINSSDLLQIFTTPTLEKHVYIDGSPSVFSNTNWPDKTIIVPGDSVTFLFSTNSTDHFSGAGTGSQFDPIHWGFAVVISEVLPFSQSQAELTSWPLDLEVSLTWLASKYVSGLIEGNPISDLEKKYSKILSSGIFLGGLVAPKASMQDESSDVPFLKSFIDRADEGILLSDWIRTSTNVIGPVRPAEILDRTFIAAALKLLGLVDDAIEFTSELKAKSTEPSSDKARKLSFLSKKAKVLATWFSKRVQIELRWTVAVEENEGISFFDEFKDAPDRLRGLCELKNVQFDMMNEGETIKALFNKLSEETALFSKERAKSQIDPREAMLKPILERLNLIVFQIGPINSKDSPHKVSLFGDVTTPSLRSSHPELFALQESGDYDDPSESEFSSLSRSQTLSSPRGDDGPKSDEEAPILSRSIKRLKKREGENLVIKSKGAKSDTEAQSPISSLLAFAQNANVAVKEFEEILQNEKLRAESRLKGLDYFAQLLKLTVRSTESFAPAIQRVLSCLQCTPLQSGSHYRAGVENSGPAFFQKLFNTFENVFASVVRLISYPSVDFVSKQKALGLFGLAFKDFDAKFLLQEGAFPLLQDLFCGKLSSEAYAEPPKPNEKEAEKEKKTTQVTVDWGKSKRALESTSWASFCLLATHCINWTQKSDAYINDKSSVLALQKQVFTCLHHEFDRLSVLHKENSLNKRLRSLSDAKSIESLTSMLGSNTAPKSQRLILRLCRRLLPFQTPKGTNQVVDLFMNQIGNLLFSGTVFREKIAPSESETKPKKLDFDQEINFSLSEDRKPEQKPEDKLGSLYSVALHQWVIDEKKLLEACIATLGPEFVAGKQVGSVPKEKVNNERAIATIIQDIKDSTSPLLLIGTQDQCSRLASALAAFGGSTTVGQYEEANEKGTDNPNALLHDFPLFWMNGHAAYSLASEYTAFLRILTQFSTSSAQDWKDCVKESISNAIFQIPQVVSDLSKGFDCVNLVSFKRALAGLSVLGGFQEILRVGGRVSTRSKKDDETGIVVSYTPGQKKASIVFDSDETKTSHRVTVADLNLSSETELTSSFLNELAPQIMEPLLSVISNNKKPPVSSQWLHSWIRSQVLASLNSVIRAPGISQIFIETYPEKIPLLIQLAKQFNLSLDEASVSSTQKQLQEQLWDISTIPSSSSLSLSESPMAAILPHFPMSSKFDVLPTCFDIGKTAGLIFCGERTVEFPGITYKPKQKSRLQATNEILIAADVAIPANVVQYYFEVTIDKAPSGPIISIGLSPQGSPYWDHGSFRFQANGNKTWFPRSARKVEKYGGAGFRQKDTIGCGWNSDTRSIFFTKNGVDLGPAFVNVLVHGEKVVPAVAIGKGVKATINFGQEKFCYQLTVNEEIDASVALAKQKALEKQKQEMEEEERKEAEREKAELLERVSGITSMGFSLAAAIRAIQLKGSDIAAAVEYLLNEEREPEPEAPPPEPEKEPVAEEPSPVIQEGELPDLFYKISNSSSFVLSNPCVFAIKDRDESQISAEWESTVLPFAKALLEHSSTMTRPEVTDTIQRMRVELANGNEFAAVKMFNEIAQDQASLISLPTREKKDPNATQPLKMEDVRIGSTVLIKPNGPLSDASATTLKYWVPPMTNLVGQLGVVKGLCRKRNLVHIRFYNSESSVLQEWWFPIGTIHMPSRQQGSIKWAKRSDEAPADLEKRASDGFVNLSQIYARSFLVTLLRSFPLSINGILPVRDMLKLASHHFLSSFQTIASSNLLMQGSNKMQLFEKQLRDLYTSSTLKDKKIIAELLIQDGAEMLKGATSLDSKTVTVEFEKSKLGVLEHVHIPEAKALFVLFDRLSLFPPNLHPKISFYSDVECTNLITTVTHKAPPRPFFVPGNSFFHKLVVKGEPNTVKYKFFAVPVSVDLACARWNFEFIMNHTLDSKPDLATIFNLSVNYLYLAKTPSAPKRSIMLIVSELLYILRSEEKHTDLLESLPLDRIDKLKQEMILLYENETKKPTALLSSYLHGLIDLVVSKKLYTHRHRKEKAARKAAEAEIAIAIAAEKALAQAAEKAIAEKAIVEAAQKAIAQVTAESRDSTAEPKPKDAKEPKPEEPKPDEPKPEEPKPEEPKSEEPKPEEPKPEEPKPEEPKPEEPKPAEAKADQSKPNEPRPEKLKEPEMLQEKEPEKVAEGEDGWGSDYKLDSGWGDDSLFEGPGSDEYEYGEDDEELKLAMRLSMLDDNPNVVRDNEKPPVPQQELQPESEPQPVKQPQQDRTQEPEKKKESKESPAASKQEPAPVHKAPKVKKQTPWVLTSKTVSQMLEYYSIDDKSVLNPSELSTLTKIVKGAWFEIKEEDTISDRLVALVNIPSVPIAQLAEYKAELQQIIEQFKITIIPESTYLPISKENKTTENWCILELTSSDSVTGLTNSLKNYKLKLSANLQGSTEAKANVQVKAFDSSCPEFKQYLRSLLCTTIDKEPQITPKCQTVLEEIFTLFAGSLEGVLSIHDFKRMIKQASYTPFTDKQFESIQADFGSDFKEVTRPMNPRLKPRPESSFFKGDEDGDESDDGEEDSGYEVEPDDDSTEKLSQSAAKVSQSKMTKPDTPESSATAEKQIEKEPEFEYIPGKEETVTGLSYEGFLKYIMKRIDQGCPADIFGEFFNLGYDLRLNKAHHVTFAEAVKDTIQFSSDTTSIRALNEQLLVYTEGIFGDIPEIKSPLNLRPSHILSIPLHDSAALVYPALVGVPSHVLRLHFLILQKFNSFLSTFFPVIRLSSNGLLVSRLLACRSLIFHSVKMEFFYQVLDATSVDGSTISQPIVTINRLKLGSKAEQSNINKGINDTERSQWFLKNTSFGLAFTQLRNADPQKYRQTKPMGNNPHYSITVTFEGENVEGLGGPYRQFFTDISKELQEHCDLLPLFVPCPNAQSKTGAARDKYVLRAGSKSPLYLRMYRFLGQLMGISIRTGVLLTLDLPPFFWKSLAGIKPTEADLKEIDFDFYQSLKYLKSCTREQFDEIDTGETFTIMMSDKTTQILRPGGEKTKRTFENKGEWVKLATKARLEEGSLQMKAIRVGLYDLIPPDLLKLCTPLDLEWRVCGKPFIDISLLKRHTEYNGVSATAPHIIYFWQVLQSFSQEDRRAFVRFAWAQERLPVDDQEFKRTSTRMLIKPFGGNNNPDGVFPKADTCFFNLMIPEYSSPEVLKERFLVAIHTDADSMNADDPSPPDDDYYDGYGY